MSLMPHILWKTDKNTYDTCVILTWEQSNVQGQNLAELRDTEKHPYT